jgi:hypothetical protein
MSCEVVHYNSRLWVTRDGRPIGGYNANELRSYVFPLYTPLCVLVIQEAPPDHPHHQGMWAGLEVDGHDLWNAGSFKVPRNRQELVGKLDEIGIDIGVDRVTLTHAVRWTSVGGADLLREERTVVFYATDEATVVEWQSVFNHPDKATRLGQTKESGLAIRVPPHWETRFGGRIRNAEGATSEPGCFDTMSPWLNVEGSAGGDRTAGVVLVPTTAPCPWFTRDYGIHIYNPARHSAIALQPGQKLTWSQRVLAYDGARSIADVNALVASS